MSFPADNVLFTITTPKNPMNGSQTILFAKRAADASEHSKKYEYKPFVDFTLKHTYCPRKAHILKNRFGEDHIIAKEIMSREDIVSVNNLMEDFLHSIKDSYTSSFCRPHMIYLPHTPKNSLKFKKLRASCRVNDKGQLSVTYKLIETETETNDGEMIDDSETIDDGEKNDDLFMQSHEPVDM